MLLVKKSFDEEFPTLVEDYNKRAENMWKEYMEKMDNFDRMLDTRIAVEISKMSDEQKNMTIGQMLEAQKKSKYEEDQEENEQSNIFEDSVIGKFENLRGGAAATSIRTTVKKSTRKPPAHVQRDPQSSVRQSSRKRRGNDTSNDNMLSDLTSTVKKSSSSRSNLSVPCTPINPIAGGMVNMTPMITPKFNMATPLHRTIRRDPKQNEFLVSLNGSPVMGTVTKAAGRGKGKNKEPVPMIEGIHVGGTNFSLQLPVAGDIDVGGLELEDAHYEKLSIISQGINKLLSMRAASSTDSE